MNKIWEQPMFSLISLEYIQVNGCAVRTRLFGRNAKGHVPLVTSLTANTKLTAKPLMRSIVNGCMYANQHRFTTILSCKFGAITIEKKGSVPQLIITTQNKLGSPHVHFFPQALWLLSFKMSKMSVRKV